jgi:hypothetical protein
MPEFKELYLQPYVFLKERNIIDSEHMFYSTDNTQCSIVSSQDWYTWLYLKTHPHYCTKNPIVSLVVIFSEIHHQVKLPLSSAEPQMTTPPNGDLTCGSHE